VIRGGLTPRWAAVSDKMNYIYTQTYISDVRRFVVTQEYDFDFCSGFAEGSQMLRCSWPLSEAFKLKIHWAKMLSFVVRRSIFRYAR
jgi:hypothetical protein